MVNHFWQRVEAILEDVSVAELFDAKLLHVIVPSFSVPKMMVLRHM